MDSPSLSPESALASSTPGSNDATPRVKLLCSFLGSILPRPHDGKLRYVGGETRIVSVPRNISYEELMTKMRELYDGATVLKYQQPDEDLDALVSVVNDDDVTNMMEEYEKLGSSDGFTRLRIFLFSHPDQDGLSQFIDGNERENERRFVDALKSLNECSDFRKCDSPVMTPVSEDFHLAEQYLNSMSIDGGLHIQRSGEIPIPVYNMHSPTIPQLGSVQFQQHVPQRYNEMEGPWSPVCYSPSQHGHHTPRTLSTSPSSRYRVLFPEFQDKCMDRMQEEYVRQRLNRHPQYEHQPHFSDSVVCMPTGAMSGDKACGFPGNILHSHGVYEGNHLWENGRVTFCRNQSPHLEHSNIGNTVPQVNSPGAECPSNREAFMVNADGKLPLGFYSKDQVDPSSAHGETHGHERGWDLQHQLNPCVEEVRNHAHGAGRLNDHNVVDGTGMNLPLEHANLSDGHYMLSNYVNQRARSELGNEVFNDQAVVASPHMNIPPEEHGAARYGNYPYPYGGDNVYQALHVHMHSLWRNVQNQTHGAPAYEACSLPQQVNYAVNAAFFKDPAEAIAKHRVATDSQNTWVESPQKVLSSDGNAVRDIAYVHPLKVDVGPHCQETQDAVTTEPVQARQDMLKFATSTEPVQLPGQPSILIHDTSDSSNNQESQVDSSVIGASGIEDNIVPMEDEANHVMKTENSDVPSVCCPEQNKIPEYESKVASNEANVSNCLKLAEKGGSQAKPGEKDTTAAENSELSVSCLSFIPDFVASVTKVALEEVEEVKAKCEDFTPIKRDAIEKEAAVEESESVNAHGEFELDSDNGNETLAKIEPTKAEEEAFARGLQTIKNDDLEEIRELGSGTYGTVYQGKWKGSVVAIKRIKASCFAGRPSQRERMIADFWKEALILSSLHHPNVVSFYGIVRDSPDGSLATVSEFMVNGSLKQFFQKKDRTIDRRKRLIIAMDVAFGMEYLHAKNIVHFDLKCENLLVNMRDPQRPVCKIGDLGLSKVRQHTLVSGGVRGTLPWMAPELLSGKSDMVSEKIDIYSFGIVMWELLTGEEPYADIHCASIIGGIVNNTLRPKIPSWCDPEWKALMEKCWAYDPAERPSFSEISQKLRNMAAAMNIE
ncbi:uncharacterized protein LOC120157071 [Hibiscus syriacus]|uniref:uncharacterized protein LOC120157071 n=1 Tax=Hibiscus syriacus TaxID=106335 RepID=UPI001923050C|nr:uncharacterized protein LOC120157071 [Hibiscus syriacus]